MNSPYLALDNFITEVMYNDFRIQSFAVKRKLKMTALVRKPGEIGIFRKFPAKNCLKLHFRLFICNWDMQDEKAEATLT